MAANPETIRVARGAGAGAAATGGALRNEPSLWRKLNKEYGSLVGFALATSALIVGYMGREQRRLFPDHGLGYLLGIVGSLLLLSLLLYPLRKKYKALAFLGHPGDLAQALRSWDPGLIPARLAAEPPR